MPKAVRGRKKNEKTMKKTIFSEVKEAKEVTIKRIGKVEIRTRWNYTVFARVIHGEDRDKIIFIEQASDEDKLKVGVIINRLTLSEIITAEDIVNIIK